MQCLPSQVLLRQSEYSSPGDSPWRRILLLSSLSLWKGQDRQNLRKDSARHPLQSESPLRKNFLLPPLSPSSPRVYRSAISPAPSSRHDKKGTFDKVPDTALHIAFEPSPRNDRLSFSPLPALYNGNKPLPVHKTAPHTPIEEIFSFL